MHNQKINSIWKRIWMLGYLLVGLFVLTGCSGNELEDSYFPMMLAVKDDTFYSSWQEKEEQQNKQIDYHHLKVIIFDEKVMEQDELRNKMISLLETEKELPRNTYVCVTSQMKELLEANDRTTDSLPTYLEELIENNKQISAKGFPTLGMLFEEKENQNETLFYPYLTMNRDLPVIDGFYCVKRGTAVGKVPLECGYLGFLEGNCLKEYHLFLSDGSILELKNFGQSYDFSIYGRVTIQIQCEGTLRYGNSITKEEASYYVSNYFTSLAETQKLENDIDLSNSYKKLGSHNRFWYEAWMEQQTSNTENAKMSFEENTNFIYEVHVAMTSDSIKGGIINDNFR